MSEGPYTFNVGETCWECHLGGTILFQFPRDTTTGKAQQIVRHLNAAHRAGVEEEREKIIAFLDTGTCEESRAAQAIREGCHRQDQQSLQQPPGA